MANFTLFLPLTRTLNNSETKLLMFFGAISWYLASSFILEKKKKRNIICMVSSRYYKEYFLMKKQYIMERDHIGFIADCTFSSITISKFTTYNWTIGPKILCSKDKVRKEFKKWGETYWTDQCTNCLRMKGQDSRLRAGSQSHPAHLLYAAGGKGDPSTLFASHFVFFVLSCFYCIDFLFSGGRLDYTLYL